jgi:hypothetical protein
VGKARLPHYSRGIRQGLYRLARERDWRGRYNILIGAREDIPGDYQELLARSKFCLLAPGQLSPRMLSSGACMHLTRAQPASIRLLSMRHPSAATCCGAHLQQSMCQVKLKLDRWMCFMRGCLNRRRLLAARGGCRHGRLRPGGHHG